MVGTKLIPGRYSPRFAAGFGWYTRRLIAKSFHAVRLARGSDRALRDIGIHDGPVIIALSHASWWDPLIAVLLGRTFMPDRAGCAPMDATQLRKFGFFRRLGLFGIDPDAPESLEAMRGYVEARFRENPRTTLWLTPQGRFADPRAEIVVRPGAAAIAATMLTCRVLTVAVEYAFWLDKKPEVFLRCVPVGAAGSTTAWQRAIVAAMRENAAALAGLVIARDPAAFEVLLGSGAGINPVYDAWLRAKGASAAIDSTRVASGTQTPGSGA